MSEDKEKIVDRIDGLATTVVTAYVRYISEHRDTDSASVVTASALYVAIIVDALSYDVGDPSEKEVMSLVIEAAMTMLRDKRSIREYMKKIVGTVMEERH
jgi:hypothetical protein